MRVGGQRKNCTALWPRQQRVSAGSRIVAAGYRSALPRLALIQRPVRKYRARPRNWTRRRQPRHLVCQPTGSQRGSARAGWNQARKTGRQAGALLRSHRFDRSGLAGIFLGLVGFARLTGSRSTTSRPRALNTKRVKISRSKPRRGWARPSLRSRSATPFFRTRMHPKSRISHPYQLRMKYRARPICP